MNLSWFIRFLNQTPLSKPEIKASQAKLGPPCLPWQASARFSKSNLPFTACEKSICNEKTIWNSWNFFEFLWISWEIFLFLILFDVAPCWWHAAYCSRPACYTSARHAILKSISLLPHQLGLPHGWSSNRRQPWKTLSQTLSQRLSSDCLGDSLGVFWKHSNALWRDLWRDVLKESLRDMSSKVTVSLFTL